MTVETKVECIGKEICVKHNRYYSTDHLWIQKTSDENIKLGVTDYAQRFLKKKVALIEFRKHATVDDRVEEGEVFCIVYGGLYADPDTLQYECMAFDIISPVNGTIVEINQAIIDKPCLVNIDCYDKGWLAVIKPANKINPHNSLIKPVQYIKLLKNLWKSPFRIL